jgi:hypothetical protein
MCVSKYAFTVQSTDERRILLVRAERIDSAEELHEKIATSKTSNYKEFLASSSQEE